MVNDLNLARPIAVGGTGATTAAGARTNLGVSASDATITAIAALDFTTAGSMMYSTAADTFSLLTSTVAGRSMLTAADAAAQKTLLSLNNVDNTSDATKNAASVTLTNKTIALGSNTVSGTTAQFNAALSDGDFATLAGSETLTNKTINLTSNTLSGTTAQFNSALSDGDFATLAGSETLTNKTLTSPTMTTPTLGVASATSVNKVAITAPATSATLTIADGKTLTASNTLTLAGTDSSTLNIGSGGTLGTAAFKATGTSGNTVPLLDGANTHSGFTSLGATIAGWIAGTAGIAAQVVGANAPVNNGGNLRVLASTSHAADVGGSITLGGYYIAQSNSIDFAEIAGRKENGTSGNAAGYLALCTRDSGGNMTEKARISSAGVLSVGGAVVPTVSSSDTLTNKTLTTPTINGGTSSAGPQVSGETTGALTSASRNKVVQCSGNITLPASGMTDGDVILIDPRGSARTVSRPAAHTMYKNDVDSSSGTTNAHNIVTAMYHGSSKWTVQGAIA